MRAEREHLSNLYTQWLLKLLPPSLYSQFHILIVDDLPQVETVVEELALIVGGYHFPVEIASIAVKEPKTSQPPSILFKLAKGKFVNTDPKTIRPPVTFSSSNFSRPEALALVSTNPDFYHLAYRLFTEPFSDEEAVEIIEAYHKNELTLADLAAWQRPRVIPSTELIRFPKEVHASRDDISPSTVSSASIYYPKLQDVAESIRDNREPRLTEFAIDATLPSTRTKNRVEKDQVINLVLVIKLLESTKDISSTEGLREYLLKHTIDIDFLALHETLISIVKGENNKWLKKMKLVTSRQELIDLYVGISLWLVVAAEQFFVASKYKEFVLPFSPTMAGVPLEFAPYAALSFLLYIHELPKLVRRVGNVSGNKELSWLKLIDASTDMTGATAQRKMSHFEHVLLRLMQKELADKVDEKTNEKIIVTPQNMASHLSKLSFDTQQRVIKIEKVVYGIQDKINAAMNYYRMNPSLLGIGNRRPPEIVALEKDLDEYFKLSGIKSEITAPGEVTTPTWERLSPKE